VPSAWVERKVLERQEFRVFGELEHARALNEKAPRSVAYRDSWSAARVGC